MTTIKFHKAPNLGVEEPYGNIDAHKVSRLGVPSNASADDFENRYISGVPIKIKELVRQLSSNYFENNKFDAENYIDHQAIAIAKTRKLEEIVRARKEKAAKKYQELLEKKIDNVLVNKSKDQPKSKALFKPLSEQEYEDLNFRLLSSDISLNTTIGTIDNHADKNEYKIHIDFPNKSISYEYYIYYKTSKQTNNRNIAILVSSGDPDILFFFVEKVYGKVAADELRTDIYDEFIKEFEKASFLGPFIFLHENLPNYIRYAYDVEEETGRRPYKLTDELLWKHFLKFVYADLRYDASYYVIYIMTLITPKYCIQKFREDQSFVIQVYNGLDDRNFVDRLFGDYKYSEIFSVGKNTVAPGNKDAFVTLLNSYIQLHENDPSVAVFESSGAHFHQGDIKKGDMSRRGDFEGEYWLISDTEDDKIYLKNRWRVKRNLGEHFSANGNVNTYYENPDGYNEEGHYNPLDIVKFTQYNDKGVAITTNVPVILVYHADYVEDWERIYEGIRFGVNVLMIAVGAATIYSGVGSLMLYATIADMGLATTDIIIQGKVKKGHFDSEAGKEFLESWEKIYTIGGIATFSPVAIKFVATYGPKIASAGADLLLQGKIIANPQTYIKVKDFTTKAIHSIEIPNFNKTGLQILKKGFDNIPELAGALELQKLGVVFVKGAENTYAAIYKGVTIASGKVRGVAKRLYIVLNELNKEKIITYLEDLLLYINGIKAGTGGSFKYLKEVTSKRIFCQEQPMSCSAACIRQLAKDNGINIAEEAVRKLAKTNGFDDGTFLHRIEPAMREVFIGKEIQVGHASAPNLSNIDIIKTLSREEKPWIATLQPPGRNRHTIIVDKVVDNNVHIRDPWGKNYGFSEEFGVEAIMKLDDFEYFWKGSNNHFARIIN